MRRLIITPTYNERDNIAPFVASVLEAAPGADLLVVDDGSPDGTGEIADRLARATPRLRVRHRPGKLGLGSAYREAYRDGLSRGYEQFVQMDADFSHDPRYLPVFFEALDEGADVVVGSRNVPGGGVRGWGPLRHVISRGGSLYARALLGLEVHDVTSGFRAFSRRALAALDPPSAASRGYSFQIEMTCRASRRGLAVREIPIVFRERARGCSKMSAAIFFEAAAVVWRLRGAAAG